MRVRGNTPVLWRGQGESQLGAEPGTALVLTGLSHREQQFLDRLHNSLEPALYILLWNLLKAVISLQNYNKILTWSKKAHL